MSQIESPIPHKTKHASSPKSQRTPKKKTVAFHNQNLSYSSLSEDSDTSLEDGQVQSIVENNSVLIQEKCLSRICGDTQTEGSKQPSSPAGSKVSYDYPLELPLSSDINNNTIISIHLSPQDSGLKNGDGELMSLKLKRRMEDEDIQIFAQFAQKHELQMCSNSSRCLTFKKQPSKAFKLFNCLIFKSAPAFTLKVEILDAANQIRITLVAGRPQEFLFYQAQLKNTLWERNFIKLDEAQSINYLLDSHTQSFSILAKQLKHTERLPPAPATLEGVMQSTVSLREQLLNKARQRDTYQRIRIEEFIDRKLFSNVTLLNLYKRAYSTSEEAYQKTREKIVESSTKQSQFEYLQVPQQYRLGSLINPYAQAIQELTKINLVLSPLQKLQTIKDAHRLIREAVSQATRRVIQLDELLPILVYTVLNSKVSYIYANIGMVDHFLQHAGSSSSSEQKLVNNLYMSVEYIVNSWEN